jgi:hypothetical protein
VGRGCVGDRGLPAIGAHRPRCAAVERVGLKQRPTVAYVLLGDVGEAAPEGRDANSGCSSWSW